MALIRRRENDQTIAPSRAAWDPFEIMQQMLRWEPFRDLSRALDMEPFVPSFDVKETKDAYQLRADLPGLEQNEVEISVTGNRLSISGARGEEHREEGERYFAQERSYGSFFRAFTLPEDADAENVRAELKNGVLTVAIPKKPESKPRRVELKSGEGEQQKPQEPAEGQKERQEQKKPVESAA